MASSERFQLAAADYALLGVDVEAALNTLAGIPISIHCWQGDDVIGFDGAGAVSGGIQATGNYPGRARNFTQLKQDIETALRLIPGQHRLNLHASYAVLSLIHISEPTRQAEISYAVFCLKKKKSRQ